MLNRRFISVTAAAALAVLASVAALGQAFRILDDAPLDKVVAFTAPELQALFRTASREGVATTRLLEGGDFNVNIRHIENVSPDNYRTLVHPDTIDVWVVQAGSGTVVTGGERTENSHTGGEERYLGVGDLVFIPAGMPHGIKETDSITWLNIRFPEHRN